ncbi:YitT family protein [Selenomonas ruminantium]|uniref:YitT family protein n=1 Tax=Selenomonas ruminantium TaxID=971 RepID=UPI000408CD94|nr:YitT family protein [Selenomonas ruminantium]
MEEQAGYENGNTKQIIGQHRKTSFYVKKYAMIFVGAIIAAFGLEEFLIPNNVIDGGIVGVSIMMETITGISLGVFLVILNIPFLFMGYKQIGKNFAIATLVAICFLAVWSEVFEPLQKVTDDPFLAAIFGGIIDGLGVGLIIRAGGSLDGTEIVAIIMDKKSVFSVGEVVMFINLFILSSAGLLYGWDKAMYSLVAYFVISKMIDVVIKGLDESYAVMIVTNAHDEITSALNDRLGRGVTLLHGAGGYTGESKEVLYCVVTRLEVDKLKEIVLDKDENAFVTINAVHDIVGGRFKKKSIH